MLLQFTHQIRNYRSSSDPLTPSSQARFPLALEETVTGGELWSLQF
jgi:hypothetical protein